MVTHVHAPEGDPLPSAIVTRMATYSTMSVASRAKKWQSDKQAKKRIGIDSRPSEHSGL